MSRERIGGGPSRTNMVNGRLARRFGCVRTAAEANREGAARWAKKSLPPSKSGGTFDRYLSDLYSPFAERIGALGLAPTFPDDSEAELQEVCVTAWREREGVEGLWRRL